MKITVEFTSLDKDDEDFERKLIASFELFKGSEFTIINIIPSGELTFDLIEEKVCEHTSKYFLLDITPELISTAKRKREVVVARQLCYYISRNNQLGSWAKIGQRFGNKDHATSMHGYRTITNLLQTDREFRKQHKQFIESFK
jgi:chromosomal replication initiation ATPase DnaA